MATGEKSWVVEIRNQIKDIDTAAEIDIWRKRSIYQVPACIKDLNEKAYKPQVVSFGPYHNGEAELKAMEEHKRRALLHFLKRADKPFDDFVASMEEVVEELQDAYQSLEDRWRKERDEFLKMMIMDGCFMLEILRIGTGRPSDYAFNDPIFSTHGMLYTVPYIKRDMLMIENQVPLLVLERLVSVESGKEPNDDQINRFVLKFCAPNAPPLPPGVGLGLHVVDLYRKSLLQGPAHHETSRFRHRARHPEEVFAGGGETIRSAMELYEAGIRFKKSRTTSLRDIRFSHGVLSLPVIVVDDATEYLLLNLMAFERLHVGAGNEVTSYVFFMDNIIDSAKDVSLLHEKGIIQNAVGSDKALAKLFNSLSKDVTLDPESSLDEVHKKVHEYCRKSWNKWRANLIHTYFRSPWAFLSLAAAIFLIVMTVAQTIYTVYPYYKPSPYGNDAAPSPSSN
ncbi:uncharacterized protein M6B38_303055 [Iris pallida]|uniref:Uncharacterized protein n=1 Tax=Iris pallida TaxID=29817 RepID=A0AAX6HNW5_IRIPA|nr:uncharacterized protein M6B38_167450 [Iris pallida]KAJ6842331.1 uncharacterized protein M6B38_303055 [Iris pallida]